MRRLATVTGVVALLVLAGCFRTRYTNLVPPDLASAPAQAPVPLPAQTPPPSGWRHFFIFGWVPSEMVIDAAQPCGGAQNVEAIETRQTFVQGLIEQFATYYINIYAPWSGRVVCRAAMKEEP